MSYLWKPISWVAYRWADAESRSIKAVYGGGRFHWTLGLIRRARLSSPTHTFRARKISNHAMSDSDRTTLARRMMYSTYIESVYIDWCGLWQFQRKCKALFCEFMYMFAFNGNDMNQMDFCIHSITMENEMDFAFVNCIINIKKVFLYAIVRVSCYVDQK